MTNRDGCDTQNVSKSYERNIVYNFIFATGHTITYFPENSLILNASA